MIFFKISTEEKNCLKPKLYIPILGLQLKQEAIQMVWYEAPLFVRWRNQFSG